MRRMVCGFIFGNDMRTVLLTRMSDIHPVKVIRGRWNGVGGKIEEGETAAQAMEREAFEETGLVIAQDQWTNIITLRAEDWEVDFYFHVLLDKIFEGHIAKGSNGVSSRAFRTQAIATSDVVFNLNWLIPLCMDENIIKPLGDWHEPWTNLRRSPLVSSPKHTPPGPSQG